MVDLSGAVESRINFEHNQRSIGQGEVLQIDFEADVDLDMFACDAMLFLCILIDEATETSSFHDSAQQNNIFCFDVSATKVCSPGTDDRAMEIQYKDSFV